MIKEKRELVLVPRETPLNALHLKNMTKLNGIELKGNETFDELLRKGKKKKDNSKKGDIFLDCRI